MAPKRPAEATSSSSSDEAASSSDEEHEEEPLPFTSPRKTAAQKKPPNPPVPVPVPVPVPKPKPSERPAASSSDDDDDDDEEEEEGSSDGDEEETSESESEEDRAKKQPPPPPPPPPPPKPAPQPTASGSGDESGSESDSEEESSDDEEEEPAPARLPSRGADPSIKAVNSKPMDEAPLPKKPAPVPSRDSEALKKKVKASEPSENEGGGQKRQLIQRIWSPDDEIVVLSGLVEYRSKKARLPSLHEMDQLHNQIRGSLQVEVGNNQLHDKIRRLKRKFATSSARGKNGADPTFSKPQERTAFELSKKIWGAKKIVPDDAGASSGEESDSDVAGHRNPKEENAASPAVSPPVASADGSDISPKAKRYPLLTVAVAKLANECKCGVAMKRALENLEDSRARAMEEKVKRLKMTEMKLHLRRMDLMKETVRHILEALAKSEG